MAARGNPCERCGDARHDTTFCDGCQLSLCGRCWGDGDGQCEPCEARAHDQLDSAVYAMDQLHVACGAALGSRYHEVACAPGGNLEDRPPPEYGGP